MELLSSIDVRGGRRKRVELYRGDITTLSEAEAFDVLVVSAFPDDYSPTAGSLIGALARKGLSVASLAADKDVDLRKAFSCWLSHELTARDPDLRFRRIMCFEPQRRGRPPEVVGDIFRALTPILAERPEINDIAMPILAAGDQRYSVEEMLTPLLDAGLHWLATGLPLDTLRIVAYTDAQARTALEVFASRKREYDAELVPPPSPDVGYDVFLSYSRANARESEALERYLRQAQPGVRIFVDRNELDIGSAWQPEIFETLDRCRKVVALLSPDYLSSKVCKEEFNIAWIRGRETDSDVIFPVYLYTAALPTYMKYRNYVDCREGDETKIADASRRLLVALGT